MKPNVIATILDLDIRLQRQIYAGWPESWADLRWPVGSLRTLLLIEAGYARNPSDVSDILKVNRTTVTGILDRLESDNLITRRIDAQDRRCFILELTDAGRDLVRKMDAMRRDQLQRALETIDDRSVEALHQGLRALTDALGALQTQSSQSSPEDTVKEKETLPE